MKVNNGVIVDTFLAHFSKSVFVSTNRKFSTNNISFNNNILFVKSDSTNKEVESAIPKL